MPFGTGNSAAAEEARFRQRQAKLRPIVMASPLMEIRDEQAWRKERSKQDWQNESNRAILRYAQSWARLMQLRLRQGRRLADIWRESSFEADFYGMSGASGGVAAQIIARHWTHGPEFWRLYTAESRRR
jgi:hypothetical protein